MERLYLIFMTTILVSNGWEIFAIKSVLQNLHPNYISVHMHTLKKQDDWRYLKLKDLFTFFFY